MPVICRHECLIIHARRITAAMHMQMIATHLLKIIQAQRIRAAKSLFAHCGHRGREDEKGDGEFHGQQRFWEKVTHPAAQATAKSSRPPSTSC